ncbi:uncharacterized protein [Nicotiana tomentosiformis]|uniref:uncharacterized protein n=1 Tax=Nicotiana tomentosiformis TaxID=4098 RepID=UPI00388C88B1
MVEAWLLLGDFNTMFFVTDRINGNPVSQNEVEDFQACVKDTRLEVADRIYSNIDWALGNPYWFMKYSNIEAVFDNYGVSDHSPIIVCTEVTRNYLPKPFRLLTVLLQEDEFRKMVQGVWTQNITGYTMYSVWQKLLVLGSKAKVMNIAYNSVEKRIENLKDQLQKVKKEIDDDVFNNTLILEEKELLMQVEKWEGIQEKVYRQKSKAVWISAGDSNTKFFYAQLKARHARNRVSIICNDLGQKLTDPILVEQEFISFFKGLLGTRASELPCLDITIARNGPYLNREQQHHLVKSITEMEIEQGLKNMPSDKALALMVFQLSSSRNIGILLDKKL